MLFISQAITSNFYLNTNNQVRVALTGLPNELSISWQSNSSSNAILFYSYNRADISIRQTGRINQFSACSNYRSITKEVILKNLLPKTRIYFQVVQSSSENDRSKIYTVMTPPKSGALFDFTFLAYGDTDINTPAGINVLKELIAEHSKNTIEFAYHLGDFAYDSETTQFRWDQLMTTLEPFTSSIPYQFTVGNHEEYCNKQFENYKNRFTSSIGTSSRSNTLFWHSWDYSHVHFISISSEHPHNPGSQQYTWLEQDLKKVDRTKTPWVVVGVHRPMYSSNKSHGSRVNLRNDMEPLFEKYNVDVVLAGHVHVYERTCRVSKEKCLTAEKSNLKNSYGGTVHFCIGTAGRRLYTEWETQPSWSKKRKATYGYSKIRVTKTSFLFEFFELGGNVYDRYQITKTSDN